MDYFRVIYWAGKAEVSVFKTEILASSGTEPTIVTDLDSLMFHLNIISGLAKPIIVVDASGGESELSDRLVELGNSESLRSFPIAIVGPLANERISTIQRRYTKVVGIDSGSNRRATLLALSKTAQWIASICAPEREQGTERVQSNSVEFDPRALPKGRGGASFALLHSLEFFDDELFLAEHPEKDKILLALKDIDKGNALLAVRSRRSAILSSLIASQVGVSGDKLQSVQAAALLLPWAFKNQLSLIAHDLLFRPDDDQSRELATKIAESSKFIRESMQDSGAADFLEIVSESITYNSTQHRSSIEADCLLGMELTDRSCWVGSTWNRYGAKRAKRKIISGEPFKLNSAVAANIALCLAEAEGMRLLVDPKPSLIYEGNTALGNQLLLEASMEAETKFAGQSQKTHSLDELRSGMVLSQPLVTSDGILLLRSDTKIQPQHITAIRKLASIRQLPSNAQCLAA